MSRHASFVDLGPMALPVGEAPEYQTSCYGLARQIDIKKMSNLLKGDRQDGTAPDPATEMPPPTPIPATLGAAADEIEAMSSLVGSMEKMAASIRTQSPHVAHINFREDFLSGTSLTAFEDQGCLFIELITADSSIRQWLERKLPWLVSYLGRRLKRSLQISVHDSLRDKLMTASSVWSLEAGK